MQTFQDRLCALIDALGITNTKFAENLHASSAFVSMLCSGIADICRRYNVSETWLRTGEGNMRQKLTRNQEIAEFMGDVMNDPDDSPRKRFVSILSSLSVDEWQLLDEIAKKMAGDG